ncbi:MAG: efflux RND transporter periplasmic adaptor subunit [bacterium]
MNVSRLFIIVPLIFLIQFAFNACGPPEDKGASQTNPTTKESTAKSTPAAPVKIWEVSPSSLELTIKATGVLKSRHQIPISSEISSVVIQKPKEIGDPVAKNEAFLLLDPEPYEIACKQTQAGFESAQAAHLQTQRDFERAQDLFNHQNISQFEFENYQLAEKTAVASLKAAEAGLQMAERNLRLTRLTSPVDGNLAELNAQIGEQIAPGRPLGTIVALNQMEIEIGLSEGEIIHLKPGLKARLHSSAFPDEQFDGTVRSVGIAGLDLGKTFPVLIAVENSSKKLHPGMIVSAEIIYWKYEQTVVIPQQALMENDAGAAIVYVLEGEIAAQRIVKVKDGNSQFAVIESGLSIGEQLIVAGQNALHDSSKVKIL